MAPARTARSAAAPAPKVAVEYLYEARQAAAILSLRVGQALPKICECVVHPIRPARVQSADAFVAQMSILAFRFPDSRPLGASCSPLGSATETRSPPRSAK